MRYSWAQFRSYLRLARKRSSEAKLQAFLLAGGKDRSEYADALRREIAAAGRPDEDGVS
jgi:hypothetical protein